MSISRDHHFIINELMKVSEYQNNDGDNCKGIALVGLEDAFAGKFQLFESMMDYIISTPLDILKKECLNKESPLAIFLKRIYLFHYKSHISNVFFQRLFVAGVYPVSKLKMFLQTLVSVAESSQFNHLLGLSLESGNHAISFTYHRESKAFLFINANLKPKPFIVIYDIDEVVKLIRAAFCLISNDQKSLFSTTIHTIKSNNDLVEKNIIDTMALLDNTLSPMHEPTAEDACYVDPVTNVNLAWIAARERKIELIKKLKTLGANIHQVNNEGASSLYIACERGHLDVVKFLIEQGANIHQVSNEGVSPLYIACQEGHLAVVNFLVTKGANIHQVRNGRASPFFMACQQGHLDVVKLLIAQGADIHQQEHDGASPLLVACEQGHLDVVKFLSEQGASVNQLTDDGGSPLFIACQQGHLDVVKFLIEQSASVNQLTDDGVSPFFIACETGHLDVVKFLITQGANIHQTANDGMSPLRAADIMGRLDIKNFLTEQCQLSNELICAAKNGNLEAIKNLIQKGVNVNQGDEKQQLPLRVAIENEQFHAFNYLVENGANINLINFAHIFLLGANLANANLSQKNLKYARLIRTNLSNANLSESNLYRANLAHSNLSGANIIGADLTEASLHGVENNIFIINSNANARRLNESVRFLPVTEQREKMSTSQIKSEILLALWHAYNLLKSDQDHTQACAIKNLIEMSNKDENKSIIDDINQWKYSNARFFSSHGLGIYTLEFINNLTRHAETTILAGNKRKFADEGEYEQKTKKPCFF